MSLKICEECAETADEAKAFCPGCGNPFVKEEKREVSSEFDQYAGTLNMSDSAFKIMLTKMDLDTSRPPDAEIDPARVEAFPKSFPPQNKSPDQNKNSGMLKWIIFAAIGAVIFIFITAVILIALYIYFYK